MDHPYPRRGTWNGSTRMSHGLVAHVSQTSLDTLAFPHAHKPSLAPYSVKLIFYIPQLLAITLLTYLQLKHIRVDKEYSANLR